MITLDACVVIAHLSPSDRHHQRADAFLAGVASEGLLMHSLSLTEVLAGGARVGRGREMLDDLLAMGIRVADHDRDESLRLADLRAQTGLKLPDCCVLDAALSTASTLATFDVTLAAFARRRHLATWPDPVRP